MSYEQAGCVSWGEHKVGGRSVCARRVRQKTPAAGAAAAVGGGRHSGGSGGSFRKVGAELARDIAKALTLNPDELLLTGRGRIAAVHEEAPARGGEAMICPGRGRRPKGGTAEAYPRRQRRVVFQKVTKVACPKPMNQRH